MTVKITKPEINIREKIAELDKPSGIAGEAMLRAETVAEQQALIGVGRRNLIINGAMNVSQRGTTFDKDSFTGAKYYSLDRFHIQSDIPSCDHTTTQTTDAPEGFSHSLKYTQDTTASTYPAYSSQYHRFRHHLEGQDCKQLQNKPCVLSFWVKSSIVGKFDVAIFAPNSSSNHMVLPYNIHSANTWEKKELSFIGPAEITAGAVTLSLDLQWQLARSGTSYQTSATNVWGATNLSSPDSTDAIIKTAGATWQITGIQLELGKVATPFEHRSYGEELALCQRYYQRITGGGYTWITEVQRHNSTGFRSVLHLPVPLRVVPSISYSNLAYWYNNGSLNAGTQSISVGYTATGRTDISHLNLEYIPTTMGLTTDGNLSAMLSFTSAGGYLAFSSEL
jgi:hypothetical protein